MKNALFAAAAAATVLVAAPAFAQDASDVQWYGNLGYSFYDTDIGDAQLGGVQGRVGARFHPNFGVEGEFAGEFGVAHLLTCLRPGRRLSSRRARSCGPTVAQVGLRRNCRMRPGDYSPAAVIGD